MCPPFWPFCSQNLSTCNFCILNDCYLGVGLMYDGRDQFPTIPVSINRGHGSAQPTCAPLSYASEQHATEDLQKKGIEKSLYCASCKIMYGHPEAARSITSKGELGALWRLAANEGSGPCMTDMIKFA